MDDLLRQYFANCELQYDHKVKKYCVFCGAKPTCKTKEHVFPKWLIKYTGNLNRQITIPAFQNNEIANKKIDFDDFVFPACEDCNNHFSILEAEAKNAFIKLYETKVICANSAQTLLDWFDKLRIGCWLASQIWSVFPLPTIPKFYINHRMGYHDRILYFTSCANNSNGISFGPVDPIFKFIPSFFWLRINDMHFVSASCIGICAGSLGLPYFKVLREINGINECCIREPKSNLNLPAAPKKFNILAQACYPKDCVAELSYLFDDYSNFFLNDSQSIPYMLNNERFIGLDKDIDLHIHKYNSQATCLKASMELYSKLRKHVVTKLPNSNEKHMRI